MLGFWLQGKGASKDILIQLARCGFCVGHESLRRATVTLTEHQRVILQHAGKKPCSELRLRYDNFINSASRGADRLKVQESDAGPAAPFMATYMGIRDGEEGVELPVDLSNFEESIEN